MTREELMATFRPCPYCNRVVEREITYNIWKPFHDYEMHPGFELMVARDKMVEMR